MPLLVVALIVPSEVPVPLVKFTVSEPDVMSLSNESREVRSRLTTVPAAAVAVEAETTELAKENAPAFTVIVGNVEVIGVPFTVAPIVVAVPEVVAAKTAV